MNKRTKKEIETGCEYSFPDYMGDIKKILSCRAKCRNIGKLVADGALEVNGIVEYEVLYADSDNKLTAINTSSDYTVNAPIIEDVFVDSSVLSRVNSFSLRVTGPRRLSMRASVDNEITLTHGAQMAVSGDALDDENFSETCTRVIKIENYLYGETVEREYAEEAERLVGLGGEDVEIVCGSGDVIITEATATDGGAELRAEARLYAIVKAPNEPPFRISRVIPISESIAISGAEREMTVIPTACVTSVSFSLGDADDDKVIIASASIELSANAVVNEDREVVTDAYLLEKETRAEYSDFSYETFSEIKRESLEIVEKVPIGGISSENIRGVISAVGEILESSATPVGRGVKISGKVALSMVACEINDDGSISYVPLKHTFDFDENVNISSHISDNSVLRSVLSLSSPEALIDGNEIEVRCPLSLMLSVDSLSVINKLDSLSVIGDVEREDGSTITVYYPTEADTLFSVAKRFHKSPSSLAEANSILSEASVTDMDASAITLKKLFII